ncbi:MAG: hypothetical protein ACD_35C00037G0004 [uncultured bacterium]|nr:MAG: hypothetical protein ACD_35C00037G0004 [uncultured bacterium]
MITLQQASLRHAQYYAKVILNADQEYLKGGDYSETGLRIFDDNWKNIEIGQKWAAQNADQYESAATLASEYPERGAQCLYMRQKPTDRVVWLESALAIAQRRGFELVVASLNGKLGLAYTESGEYNRAIDHYFILMKLAVKFNDLEGLCMGSCNLGILYDNMDMLDAAQECFEYALRLTSNFSSQQFTEKVTGNLGLVLMKKGEFDQAIDCFEKHLQLARQNGDRWSEGNALSNLGIARLKTQQYEQALALMNESILINKKLDDPEGEAKNLGYIGTILDIQEDFEGAVAVFQKRISLARQTEDSRGEAIGCWNLGKTLVKQKKYSQALEYMRRCVDYEQSIGDPDWETDLIVVKQIEETFGSTEGQLSEGN